MALVEEKKQLLQELRIERGQREQYTESNPRRTGLIVGIIVAVLILGGAAAAGYYFLLRKPAFEIEQATAVAPSADPGATAVLQATGYVTARINATVSAQITGTLTQVLIEEGEHVTKGQVLARLDDTQYKAGLLQAQAGLASAQAALAQYQANLEQSKRDLMRDKDLVDRHLVSVQTVEHDNTQVQMLTAQVITQEKQIDVAAANVKSAQVYIDYTTVRAPFSGVITAKAAQVGEIVSPMATGGFTRTGVGTIVDMDSLEIEVDVNEAYINRVQANQPATATLDAYPDWEIPAHVIAIIPTADRSKATVKVRVGFDKKDPRILPDMGVRVSFQSKQSAGEPPPKGVLIPASSIVQKDGKNVVFIVDGERVHSQQVSPGQAFGDLKLVQEVSPGAHLVRTPPADMSDGARVTLKQE
ncbi:MAG TPA: efflux RND transporter periplasmic adaptor subunit [Steroidobacteraceae bacterium]|nr:efflux RND transporter periplasmic adaptor subunit [Steroidobacteraceae bacterium]